MCTVYVFIMKIRNCRLDAANHSLGGGTFPNGYVQAPGVGDRLHSHTSPLEAYKWNYSFFVYTIYVLANELVAWTQQGSE